MSSIEIITRSLPKQNPALANMPPPPPLKLNEVRQNFDAVCESALNEQINLELYASYVYLAMAYHFDRADVSLKGFHKWFKKQSDEEREHAELFMEYLNKRGGVMVLRDIKTPIKYSYDSGADAMRAAMQLERDVNESLLNLHATASDKNDPHLCTFLEDKFLVEQVESIKQIAGYLSNIERAGNEFLFERLALSD